ncbi:MAG: hypothetical protein IJY22_01415 [Clostridia bacterium]|nr:hypothetical protein [Clostridia bacterium]
MMTAPEEIERFRERCRTLCERFLLIGHGMAHYRFLEHLPQYFVDCHYGTDHAFLPLGQDPKRAQDIFDLLIRGEVTPCTMADVIHDLQEDFC